MNFDIGGECIGNAVLSDGLHAKYVDAAISFRYDRHPESCEVRGWSSPSASASHLHPFLILIEGQRKREIQVRG